MNFSQGLLGLTSAQKWLWILFLAECCKKKSETVDVNITWFANASGLSEKEILQTIETLELNNSLTVNSRKTHGQLKPDKIEEIRGEEIRGETTLVIGEEKKPPNDLHPLALIWNENCRGLSKVKELNPKRHKLCIQAWKKNKDPGYWAELIASLALDEFCSGKNDRGWKANFDYFLRPDVQTRILEGSIGNKVKKDSTNWDYVFGGKPNATN